MYLKQHDGARNRPLTKKRFVVAAVLFVQVVLKK